MPNKITKNDCGLLAHVAAYRLLTVSQLSALSQRSHLVVRRRMRALRAEPPKTLLFFLEVDISTETLASTDKNSKHVRQKIINYQTLFRSGHYKRYARVFDAGLNGFRLLFLANTSARLAAADTYSEIDNLAYN